MVGATNSNNVDDLYFSALFDDEEIFPILDEKYAPEFQLQEALMSAAIASRVRIVPTKIEEHYHHHHSSPVPLKPLKRKEKEIGESSDSSQCLGFCIICLDAKPGREEMFRSNTCSRIFCTAFISKYIATKIQDNISMVKCPELGCIGVLEAHFCQPIIPKEVFDRWENALCESLVLGSQKFYCPFKDCSALLVDDGGEKMTKAECHNCRRLFCAQCRVAWHAGVKCWEFQMLDSSERTKEDLMVMELAKNKKWRTCPNCRIYVERVSGCLHVSCRCGFEFCYGCGSQWNSTHACSS